MKKCVAKRAFAAIALSLAAFSFVTFAGCAKPTNGRDGVDGKDLTIYDIYETVKKETGNSELTLLEFLKEYLSYTPAEIEEAVSLQSAINRSLLSSVSIRATLLEKEDGVLNTKTYNGSGVIVDVDKQNGDMTVVTNCHVIYSGKAAFDKNDGYSDYISTWLYGSEYLESCEMRAEIVAASKTYDIAVLKITGSKEVMRSQAVAAEWAVGEESYIGEKVYAVGNANGDKISANDGIISKDLEKVLVDLGDASPYSYNVIRTSAEINSGNSGGGLFDYNGRLVGIVNAKGRSEALGVGYALPAASTRRVVKRMIEDATGSEAHGVNVAKHGITTEISDSYTTGVVDGHAEIREEVKVYSVWFGKAYGKIERGDVLKSVKITRGEEVIEDMRILREHNFADAMLSVRAGDTVCITVTRGEEEATYELTFDEGDFDAV